MKKLANIFIIAILFLSFVGPTQVLANNEFDENGNSVNSRESGPALELIDEIHMLSSDGWTSLPTQTDVEVDKEWTITFNQEVDPSTIQGNIYVIQSLGGTSQIQDVKVVQHAASLNKVVIQPPVTGWENGGTYNIFINNELRSLSDKYIKQPTTMEFTVEKSVQQTNDPLYVIQVDGKYGYMDKNGVVVITPKYADASSHLYDETEGLAAVALDNNRWGYIDRQGKVRIDFKYKAAKEFSGGLAEVQNHDFKTGFVNTNGDTVIPFQYNRVKSFSNGLAPVFLNGKWGFIDKSNNIVIDIKYEDAEGFNEGLLPVKENGKWGFIDTSGKMVIDFQFDYAYQFGEGLASVKKGDLWGYIDTTGQFAIEPQYEAAYRFSEGLANVSEDGKFGFINKDNELVIAKEFDWAISFGSGLSRIRVGDKWGYINTKGEVIYQPTN